MILVFIEIRERRKAAKKLEQDNAVAPTTPKRTIPEGCCGEHLVCEKETLLITNPEIVYYDDEELDSLAGIEPDNFTSEQYDMINNVFLTLREEDVAGWCRSLQMRGINLPSDIREQALMIVREQRQKQ